MKWTTPRAKKVILSFDRDRAGVKTTKRAIKVAAPFGWEVGVFVFGPADGGVKKDPDDLARTQPQLWRQMAKSSISVYEFLIQAALRNNNVKTPEGNLNIFDKLTPIFGEISHPFANQYYLQK